MKRFLALVLLAALAPLLAAGCYSSDAPSSPPPTDGASEPADEEKEEGEGGGGYGY